MTLFNLLDIARDSCFFLIPNFVCSIIFYLKLLFLFEYQLAYTMVLNTLVNHNHNFHLMNDQAIRFMQPMVLLCHF